MQHNPCVYDLKIEGYGRFYMCAGTVDCQYKGVSRDPSDKFYDTLKPYVTSSYEKLLDQGYMKKNKLVRIPDVYSFTITLQSLLPNSVNNYLFQFSSNANMEIKTDSILEFNNMAGYYGGHDNDMTDEIRKIVEDSILSAAKESGLDKLVDH